MEGIKCNKKTTGHYKNVLRNFRTLSSQLLAIIRPVNKFSGEISIQADGAPVGLCFRNSKGRPGLNGLFTDDVLGVW